MCGIQIINGLTNRLQSVMPFINRKCQELKLAESHPALVLFDCFKGQTTEDVQQMLLENNIRSVQIPTNCTDKLQPMDP